MRVDLERSERNATEHCRGAEQKQSRSVRIGDHARSSDIHVTLNLSVTLSFDSPSEWRLWDYYGAQFSS